MKIGILTFHRAHNYGAVLQCYSLQEALREMGHDAQVIDYRQPHIESVYKPIRWRSWLKTAAHMHMRKALHALKNYLPRKTRRRIFEAFCNKYLLCTAPCDETHIPRDFDAYVIGSDQLWNKLCTGDKLDSVYAADFRRKQESRVIGYAIGASMGTLEAMGDKLHKIISRFSAFSVREEIISKVIGCMTDNPRPSVCCDPALLNDATFWSKITNEKYKDREYVLVYEVRRPFRLQAKASSLAQELGCEVIDANKAQLSVEDFVSLFKYARYVLTSSFHGTAFSLIFGRPFYSFKLYDGWDARYVNILHAVNADHCCVDLDFTPDPGRGSLEPDVIRTLNAYRQASLQFLQEATATPSSPG